MSDQRSPLKPLPLHLVMLLGTISAVVIVIGFWADRSARAEGPESPLNTYATALGRGDLAGAIDQLAPDVRSQSLPFVQMQLGNRYTILESAVRGPSLLDRWWGRSTDDISVAATIEVQEAQTGNPPWRITDEFPVEQIAGRWYLLKPPLEP